MPDWREREATNETIFREMNEWTEVADDGPSSDERIDIYLRECSDRRCTDPIGMTRAQYEAVRAVPVRFATVEKFYGAAARIARASDPRR